MSDHITPPRRRLRFGSSLLPLAALLVATAFQATAHADPVVLTGGEIVVDRASGVARVNLVGNNFSLSYVDDLQFSAGFSA